MIALVREPIDMARLVEAVRRDGDGGVVTFAGVVRDRADDGRPVTGLSYEAYDEMAQNVLAAVVADALVRFAGVRIAVAHRLGSLGIGEIAVGIAASAPHRAQAFDACEFVIDELKARVPIWKREEYADGTSEWRENVCGHEAAR